jgi:hypothetical protein
MARMLGRSEVARIEGILTRLPGCTPSVRPPEAQGPPAEGERRHMLNLRALIDRTSEPFPNAALKFMARELGKEGNIEGLRLLDERIPQIIAKQGRSGESGAPPAEDIAPHGAAASRLPASNSGANTSGQSHRSSSTG